MKSILVALVIIGSACTGASTRVAPQPCPVGGIAAGTVRSLNDQPTPMTTFAPPVPVPADVRGHRAEIRVVVDTAGRVMPDSITICGLPDLQYAKRLAAAAATVRFAPARPGLSVAGPTQIGFVIR